MGKFVFWGIILIIGALTGTIGFMLVGWLIWVGLKMMYREAGTKFGCGFIGIIWALLIAAGVAARFLL